MDRTHHIEEGYFDEVSLAGLNVACTFAWPGPIHEGGGQCQAFIDERANDAQRQALLTILSGQEQEPTAFFAIFASTVQTMHAPQFVPVEVHTDRAALTASIHVPGVLDGRAEPIRNPVDGSVHRARLVLPQGFEFGETDCASATFNCSGAVKLDYAGRNAMLYDLDMGPNGIIRG